MSVLGKERWKVKLERRRCAARHRRSLRDDVGIRTIKEAVAEDRPRRNLDPRRTRGLLGQESHRESMIRVLAGRQAMDPSLSNSPRRRRTRRLRVPSRCRPIRAPCLRRPATGARKLEVVEINLYDPADAASVREDGRIGALGCSPVKLLPGESITVDFGLCPISARGVDRMGRDVRNRFLDASLR